MTNTTSPPEDKTDLSLVLGGPLYQLYLRCRLIRPPLELLRRRIIALVLISWLPLAVLATVEGRAIDGAAVPFFQHLSLHIRFLLALPLLILAEVIVHQRITMTIRQFISRGLIAPEDHARFDAAITAARRLRGSVIMEVLLLILTFTGGHWLWETQTLREGMWYVDGTKGAPLTLGGYWYVFVSVPLFRFLLYRWYFRLLIWCRFLWQISRIALRLNALHPDRAGGLGFLSGTAFSLMPVLLAQSIVLAGAIADRIWHNGMKLPQFKWEIISFLVFLMLLAFLPLTFFIFQLAGAKRRGMREYGIVASEYVAKFREKWMGDRAPNEKEPLLGSSDIQGLADLGNSFDVVREMRALPFGKQAAMQLALVLALPFLPLLLTMVPLEQIIARLLKLPF